MILQLLYSDSVRLEYVSFGILNIYSCSYHVSKCQKTLSVVFFRVDLLILDVRRNEWNLLNLNDLISLGVKK